MNPRRKTLFVSLLSIAMVLLLHACSKDKDPAPNPPNTVLPDTLSVGWTKQTISPAGIISDIFFSSPGTGFLVNENLIFKTSNGGTSWQRVYTSVTGLINIAMSSDNHALFTGYNRIFVTRNGGASFDSLDLNDPTLTDVFCVNSSVVYAVGRFFWKSTDGGTTWVKGNDFIQQALSMYFINEMTGWVAGQTGLFKTTDGGQNWQPLPSQPGPPLYTLYFVDSNNGYIGGMAGIGKTTNGGTAWTNLPFSSTGYHDLHFLTPNTGYMTDGRFLLKTTDGGQNWQKEIRLGQGSFIEVHFTDATHGWAAADKGIVVKFQ